ncbi:MAG: hypothetical protein STSR0006_00180 [Lentimicrobium sp.]
MVAIVQFYSIYKRVTCKPYGRTTDDNDKNMKDIKVKTNEIQKQGCDLSFSFRHLVQQIGISNIIHLIKYRI